MDMSNEQACIGCWLGIAHRIGSDMTYWILTEAGNIIARSTIQHITMSDVATDAIKTHVLTFDDNLRTQLCDKTFKLNCQIMCFIYRMKTLTTDPMTLLNAYQWQTGLSLWDPSWRQKSCGKWFPEIQRMHSYSVTVVLVSYFHQTQMPSLLCSIPFGWLSTSFFLVNCQRLLHWVWQLNSIFMTCLPILAFYLCNDSILSAECFRHLPFKRWHFLYSICNCILSQFNWIWVLYITHMT
jgi:hypothetical protein